MRKGLFQPTLLVIIAAFLVFPIIPHASAAAPDFALQSIAPYLMGPTGGTDTADIVNVAALNGFSGTVQLAVSYPANAYASLTLSTVTLHPTFNSNSSQLWMAAFGPGLYQFNVTGTSGSLKHTTTIVFNATSQITTDFAIYASYYPGTPMMHIVRGSSQTAHILLSGIGSFDGTVDLANQTIPAGLATSLSPRTVRMTYSSPPATYLSNLTITAPSNIPTGIYLTLVTATSGPIAHLQIITVSVEAVYTLTATPQTIYLNQGATSTSTITISTQGGYQGTINLSVPSYDTQHLTASVNPNILQLSTAAPMASATLTVNASGTIPSGSYAVSINANDGRVQQSVGVAIVATGVDFSITPTPPALTFQTGVFGTQAFTIRLATLNSFSGAVNVTSSVESFNVPPNGVTVGPNSTLVQLNLGSSAILTFTVAVKSDAIVGEHWIDVMATANFDNVPIAHTVSIAATVGGDFSVSTDASSLTVHQGAVGKVTFTFSSLNGWSGGLAFEAYSSTGQAPNVPLSFLPSYVVISAGGINQTRIVVTADKQTVQGTYVVGITSANEVSPGPFIAHELFISVIVEGPVTGPDFTISASPINPSVALGSTLTSIITLTSLNGFAGTVSLDSFSYGPSTLSPQSVTLTPGGVAHSTLTYTATYRSDLSQFGAYYQAGTQEILVMAVGADHSGHEASVNATVAPFSVTPNSPSINIRPGDSASSGIRLFPVYGWTGAVNMTVTVSPGGPIVSLDHSMLNVTDSIAGGISLLTVHVPSSTPPANYTVLISTTYKIPVQYYTPLLNYTTTVLVSVRSASPQPQPPAHNPSSTFFGLSSTVFYTLVGGGLAAVALSSFFVVRPRKGKNAPSLASDINENA